MKIISLGAGVQSSAMLLMALEGRFGDMPDAAIFADTQREPPKVYKTVARLTRLVHPFPVIWVTAGDLGLDVMNGGSGWIPTYAKDLEGTLCILKRQCSANFKIRIIRRKIRELVGPGGSAESWIGISTNEADRMKPSGLRWLVNRWPLIEEGLSRNQCAEYLQLAGVSVSKSACYFCPLKGDRDWIDMKTNDPETFARACAFDKDIRHCRPGFTGEQYLHRSLRPLDQIEFTHEKQGRMFDDGFGNECEGVCGV